MSTTKPTVVLVHGAWHLPHHYEPFTKALSAYGYDVHAPHLPTSGKLAPQSTLDTDTKVVSELLQHLMQEPRHIIIIAHSYGGAVATQALKGLSPTENGQATSHPGKIVNLVYMCAFMLQPGESLSSVRHSPPGPETAKLNNDGTLRLDGDLKHLFYADVDNKIFEDAKKTLQDQSLAGFSGVIDYPAWKHFPTTYIRCTEDNALLLPWQDRFIQEARDAGADIRVETLQASHSPFLSKTTETADIIKKLMMAPAASA